MHNQLFEAALGIAKPWYVQGVEFDAAKKVLTITVDFVAGTRFPAGGATGVHPVHDTQVKRLRHLYYLGSHRRWGRAAKLDMGES